MFFFKLFCDTQEIHKLLIQESYDDYKYLKNNWIKKYPDLKGIIDIDNYNNFDDHLKNEWIEYQVALSSLKDIVIHNILSYCLNYQNEKISKHRFVYEYKEYSYRLEQNIEEVLLDL
jgi:hypothetical protein